MASSPPRGAHETGSRAGSRFFFARGLLRPDRAWKIWWLWGIPLAWLTSALVIGAEELRLRALPSWGDALDLLRLAVYWSWCRLAWRAAGASGHPAWALPAKAALVAGLVANVLV